MIILYIVSYLTLLLVTVLVVFYFERKIPAFIQDRMGPTETGKYGLLQGIADLIKLLQKEDIRPKSIDKILFLAAPFVLFAAVFGAFAVIPLGPEIQAASIHSGLLVILAILSLEVIGLFMAGWGSNSKFSLYGAMRSISQLISYEIPLGLSMLCVIVTYNTLDLQSICYEQSIWSVKSHFLFGIPRLNISVSRTGGFLTWSIFQSPFLIIAFVIFFIASLAECNRAPFDLPEAESEIVGGYHTEYSGFRFAIFFLSEYGLMLIVCLVGSILFLGGWSSPFLNIGRFTLGLWTSGHPGTWSASIWGAFWLISKAFLLLLLQIWIRWTYPRLRTDQLVYLCWKILTPFALGCLIAAILWKLW